MNKSQSCACAGIRTCLRCENTDQQIDKVEHHGCEYIFNLCFRCGLIIKQVERDDTTSGNDSNPLVMCSSSKLCTEKIKLELCYNFSLHSTSLDTFHGLTLMKGFVSEHEEQELVVEIDKSRWAESQSGRLKQDYGPKVNFKRQKIKVGAFNGLPHYSKLLVNRMCTSYKELHNFSPVELCNLDYDPQRGSSIDPHVDDNWLWGERLVTVNLLSHTILTFTKTSQDSTTTLNVPLPRRSLVIVEGSARHNWQHAIQRKHLKSRRIAVTFRELSSDFLPGGCHYEGVGKTLTEISSGYNGNPVNFF